MKHLKVIKGWGFGVALLCVLFLGCATSKPKRVYKMPCPDGYRLTSEVKELGISYWCELVDD